MESTSKPAPKKPVLWIREPKKVEQKLKPATWIQMQTNHIGENQSIVKRSRLGK